MRHLPIHFLAFACCAALAGAAEKDPFQELVRPTDPLTPEQERAAFHLPEGFEVQLVASEPQLRKPMNLQWDVLGRLWVTESREYPFAIKDGTPGRDSVRIFSDFGPDGRARKMEVFADGLNIPTGLYPFRSPGANGQLTWKCVVWSIPNIWLMEDTDGDGRADKREPLYGPLGWERDTHGNLSSYRRGTDGWLYATHGFNNESTVRGRDGSELKIQSGNTLRVRLDGSRVEGHTWGQVNPFGLCWDDRGNLYSADCHSSPIYQLLRGAYYPSFGKPHDGLGFGPQTITHSHGSTAICAPIYVSDPSWPAELQDNMFVANPQTSRINRDLIHWKGSSSKGQEMPDFLSTSDPWFRPVDLSWGPDGALYVADFYNKIIGHYEVPLTHPERDRERGRLWRIVYRGGKENPVQTPQALSTDAAGLVKELASRNPTRRSLALQELCDVTGQAAVEPLKAALAMPANGLQKAHALWALSRLNALPPSALTAAIKDPDALVRTHALRLAWEKKSHATEARAALHDKDALVVRCAAEVLGTQPATENVLELLGALRRTPKEDDHLIHVIRIALRDQLRSSAITGTLPLDRLDGSDLRTLLEIMVAVPGEQNALLRLSLFEKLDVPGDVLAAQLPSLAQNLPVDRLEALGALARQRLSGNLEAQAAVLQSVLQALAQRGAKPGESLRAWGTEVATALLQPAQTNTSWTAINLDGTTPAVVPWTLQDRQCADGKTAPVISSFPRGEKLTGILRSAKFPLPETLRFYVCGHDGDPSRAPNRKNTIRLHDAADGRVLREGPVPRQDVAKQVEWSLGEFAGRSGYLEVIDGDNDGAYAWLAVGRFEPALPQLIWREAGAVDRGQIFAAEIARQLQLVSLTKPLFALLGSAHTSPDLRLAAAKALLSLEPVAPPQIGAMLTDETLPFSTREKLVAALGEKRSSGTNTLLVSALQSAPHRLQLTIATALCGSREGVDALLNACAEGHAAPALLRDKGIADRLKALQDSALSARVAQLTEKLPPANAELDRTIAARRASFNASEASATRGMEVFNRMCASCHAVGGKGGNIGPQLDGIGGRGPDRLLEDILDPSRNVDRAFRLQLVTKRDGTVVSGLLRREEGNQLVLADLAAQELRLAKNDVASRQETETSLMPAGLGEALPVNELNDLLAYLLNQRPTK